MNGRFLRAEVTPEDVKAFVRAENGEDYPGYSWFDLQARRSMLASLRIAGIEGRCSYCTFWSRITYRP